MSIEIKAPTFPESVADGTVATWHKQPGEACARDEHIVDIETDKVVLEVVAPADGVIVEVLKGEGDIVLSDEVLAKFESGASAEAAPAAAASAAPAASASAAKETVQIKAPTFPESVADGTVAAWHKQPGEACARDEHIVDIETDKVVLEVVAPAEGVIGDIVKNEGDTVLSDEILANFLVGASGAAAAPAEAAAPAAESAGDEDGVAGPAARKALAEAGLSASDVKGTGKGGRITKEDVEAASKAKAAAPAPAAKPAAAPATMPALGADGRVEKRVPMTRLRATIAKRLVEAQQTAAMLTTYNEVNMGPVMELRKKYKDLFQKTHNGTKLGFMSFFVKAATEALKRYPAVNASIDGNDMVYHGYQDIGVAVSTNRGLMVPVLRNTEAMGLADIESGIMDFAVRGRDGKLGMDDMQGGTFTITNGGIFGSLMSTPILNPPQTAILGMHKIQERPMAVDGQVVIQPMMYLALSYDHRMIDGKEAVQFLVTIKDLLEDPSRLLLEI
ncbi:2-oxoglutarate dehydrogenase complex dihydrolipoyllysine-residue succinyltransferase [Marinomonas mediterranea]|jgi:2-oxoglutarate dehydrogenase E2 component (EC 2.3.1.61)|uniref:Dihydrolipoyllysine-residue succinyltransferase component of 2-oxoglutarate dehydrogenase complex n=1 Tax=Marinomonas mediterranea (strain ATCC 700492 / JCM 21426 / NBRC 103028 / MMB-1) TaxID=717774 RepID=F2JY44_MARM1|nr:2-oxoglutarate dehydrogenase complex dihydrolipoyllysine-residue succinyltransferase [Marinomonas mediterranea]ADZ90780.1 2-oxoglutarate dehydrogenase, E2 subunit, dihydrolipoamide succinyltransferase [Marinomonas mediterranea MMB-1]WCN16935.1 2-oxoglutarate dehydrogenase complex dihydrolipoyllysine-residue succinyltransferase [Marinomonas mediterranea MMB-1]